MWVLKFKAVHEKCKYSDKIKASNCVLYSYPLGSFKKGNKFFFSSVNLVEGNVDKFTRLLKKDKSFKKVERAGDLIFTLVSETSKRAMYDPFYSPELFFPKPIISKPDGYEYWEIASWKREFLSDLLKILENYVSNFTLISFSNKKLDDFIFPKIIPKLTPKQKQAIILAFKQGYYDFPKRTNLEKLAKKMKISKQAFQKLLSKAEKKIIPFTMVDMST